VIPEVDAALRAHFGPLLPVGTEIRLAPPPPAGEADTLNLFLAEVREDTRALSADWDDVRDTAGTLLGRRPPARRFDLCYLATSWAADERRRGELLDAVLAGVAPDRRLDPAILTGSLAGPADEAPPVVLGFADPAAFDAAARYRGYGLPPRTVLGLVVSAPLLRPLDTDLATRAEQIIVAVDRGLRRRPTSPGATRPARWGTASVREDGADAPGR
jgi:hypothetical protein